MTWRMETDAAAAALAAVQASRSDSPSASRMSKPQHWSPDGAHLTPAGHQLVADAWLAAVKI